MAAQRRLGPWTLLHRLGHGSTGDVHAATDGVRHGALKVIRAARPLHVAAFEQAWMRVGVRLQQLRALEHPGVVRLWDHGYEQASTQIWYAMERLHGDALVVGAPLQARDVARLGHLLALGLAHAHEHGVLHGDIKPANLFGEPDGRAVLVDFSVPVLEGAGAAVGSPRWMAPECLLGGPMSAAADVYALAQSLGELAAGRALFAPVGEGPARLVALCDLKERAVAVDPGPQVGPLRKVVQQATARDPSTRPSARSLAQQLEDLVAG